MALILFLSLCVIFATLSLVTSAPFEEVQCGTSDYPGNHAGERIINGAVVPQGKYPWLVQMDFPGCTATILSRRYILTAAHCVLDCEKPPECPHCPIMCNPFDPQFQMNVIVGSVNKTEGQQIRVKRMIPHKSAEHLSFPFPNDIGIIELQEELNFTKDIRPICLSGKPQMGDPDKNVVITGWGDITGHRTYPEVLHEGTARILNDEKCKGYVNLETYICIESHNNTAPYHGDSGGPALLHEGDHWTQIGITSYGADPVDLTWPSVYARVSHYCDWIAENTNNEVKCNDV